MKIKDYIEILAIILVIVLIRTFLVTPAKVNGSSMENTLFTKELILVNKINYSLNGAKRFNIVVAKLDDKEKIIKRVIGLPGERIEYKNNELFINGKKIETPIEFEDTKDFSELQIGEDEYFLMGDNRDVSIDSRVFGPVSEKDIIGTVKLVLFPFKRFGYVK